MPYFIAILSFFLVSKSWSECKEQDTVAEQFIVSQADGEALQKISSQKTGETSFHILKKISSSKKSYFPFSGKSKKASSSFLVKTKNIERFKSKFPSYKVQKNCYVKSFFIKDTDSYYSQQDWFFKSLDIEYKEHLPKRKIIVAVSDTGVRLDHPDLKNNLWTNSAELYGQPGIDDDQNGYIDDVYGYDFADNDSNPQPSLHDLALDVDHGTHVAGLIAAQSFNNYGVSGVSLNNVKIMSLKGFKSQESTTLADLLESIYYAVDNGAQIINASWGVEKQPEYAEIAAVNYALQNNVLIVAAAGNGRVPAEWVSPASIKNVVTVSSLNSQDELSTFANYGSTVDFIAPGGDGSVRLNESLLSSANQYEYLELKGTSMSAPLVTGLLGFIMAQSTQINALQALYVLEQTSSELKLSPYAQSNDYTSYKKPSLNQALEYLEQNPNLPDVKPQLEDPSLYSKGYSSQSPKPSSGCSNSLSGQKIPPGRSTLQGAAPWISFFFFTLPALVALKLKKTLTRESSSEK